MNIYIYIYILLIPGFSLQFLHGVHCSTKVLVVIIFIILFHFSIVVTGGIILVKCDFTPGGGSGLGMPTPTLKWQWFLVEVPLFFPNHTMWLAQLCLLLS